MYRYLENFIIESLTPFRSPNSKHDLHFYSFPDSGGMAAMKNMGRNLLLPPWNAAGVCTTHDLGMGFGAKATLLDITRLCTGSMWIAMVMPFASRSHSVATTLLPSVI